MISNEILIRVVQPVKLAPPTGYDRQPSLSDIAFLLMWDRVAVYNTHSSMRILLHYLDFIQLRWMPRLNTDWIYKVGHQKFSIYTSPRI
ncbi:hypothetical protein CHS0354_029627 [Potamilus streckersoni]|uniref:Uncharacterized protein n=1 Tax=Potamilus streckersoni TaxID=2493646 RepID=A0AAE0RTN9_9BIVA|nr:hypothetical protein CHS0354_029627 [Potamilus streckersoni]